MQFTSAGTGIFLFLFMLFARPGQVVAQSVAIGDPFEEYLRIQNTEDIQNQFPSYNLRPISILDTRYSVLTNHPWQDHSFFSDTSQSMVQFYAPELITTYNTAFPSGQNDGAMWQGRGVNIAFSAGGAFQYGPLRISVRPQVGYSGNRNFKLSPMKSASGVSEFGMPKPIKRIDYPQRFGNESFSWFHPGQSFIRLQQWGWTLGVSTENMWTGPARYNPLIISNTAPGFYHLFIGTHRPVKTPAGNIETKIYWGKLSESEYFDDDSSNDERFVTGLVFNYSPSFAPGLNIGFTRTYQEYMPESGLTSVQYWRIFEAGTKDNFVTEENEDGTDETDQKISFFARWSFPGAGLETWFEFGKEDHNRDILDMQLHPEHARAYVIGISKRFNLADSRLLSIDSEITHLEVPRAVIHRINGPWYQHNPINQGWTNQGQMLGAGINMGSNSQKIAARYYDWWGLAGVSVNRIEHLNDRLRRYFGNIRSYQTAEGVRFTQNNLREIEFRFGFHGLLFLPQNLELQADIYQSFFRNRYNLYENNVRNLNVQLTVRYLLPGFSR